jgi:hypothetical protein
MTDDFTIAVIGATVSGLIVGLVLAAAVIWLASG